MRARARALSRTFDVPGVLLVLFLVLAGVVMVGSATGGTKFAGLGDRQMFYGLAAAALLAVTLAVPYEVWLEYAYLLYGAVLLVLVTLPILGHTVAGSRSWFHLGPASFQPSELAKAFTALALAAWIRELETRAMERKDFAVLLLMAGTPMVLTAAQPDFGTATTFLPLFGAVFYLSAIPLTKILRWGAVGLAALALFFALGWFTFFKPYQKERILTFLDPGHDPRGAGYQVMQARIAVGSGELTGKGLGSGTQNRLKFLPAPHTDFVFGVVAEETGFLGSLIFLGAFLALLLRLAGTIGLAKDPAGSFLAAAACFLLLYHLLINVGMVLGLLPATGIPLPFLSFGGSALLAMTFLTGLALNVRARRFSN